MINSLYTIYDGQFKISLLYDSCSESLFYEDVACNHYDYYDNDAIAFINTFDNIDEILIKDYFIANYFEELKYREVEKKNTENEKLLINACRRKKNEIKFRNGNR